MADSTTTLDDDLAGVASSGSEGVEREQTRPPVLPLRYADGRLLATGGMGDVWSFRDDALGRRVAVKVLARRRRAAAFDREVRIQARLSHPAVVPIHDIGEDRGQPYMVMSHIEGETLAKILERHRAGDPTIGQHHNRRQLLTAFVRVCQALAYAHDRGVIHRDLKPANLMLGALGEVYVLDWGIALVDDADATSAPRTGLAGTLGYMAPEQLEGLGIEDRRCDVYALGAILFEIVTLVPLHSGRTREELVASTTRGVDVGERAMAAQAVLPPELDAICRRATASRPDARYPEIAELVAELERFLDGERDEAGRRAMADALVARAQAAVRDGGGTSAVLRDAGRALALAPGHAEAALILRDALADGLDVMPPDLSRRLAPEDRSDRRRGARIAVAGIAAWMLLFGCGIGFGLREPATFVAFAIAIAIALLAAVQRAIWGGTTRIAGMIAAAAGAVALVLLARLTGPYLVVPMVAAAIMPVFPFERADHRRWVFAMFAAAVLLPCLAEAQQWIDPTTVIEPDRIVIHATMATFSPTFTPVLLALASVAALAVAHAAVGRTRGAITQTRVARARTAWQLEQVLPEPLDDDPLGGSRRPTRQ
jgi:hypothetical protein